jgi:glycerol-3-phosphate acyltransferase PlsY
VALAWLVVVPAYALGTFPTAALVGRRTGVDPTRAGSGNPGASNTFRTAGRRAGAVVLAGDLGKGALATAAGAALGGRPVAVACAVAAVLGHVAPVQRGLRGGKGVATAAGAALVLHPLPALVLAGVWAGVARATRRASLASLAIAAGLPIAAALAGAPAGEVTALTAMAALVVVRHRDNIVRLARGEERTLSGHARGQ